MFCPMQSQPGGSSEYHSDRETKARRGLGKKRGNLGSNSLDSEEPRMDRTIKFMLGIIAASLVMLDLQLAGVEFVTKHRRNS